MTFDTVEAIQYGGRKELIMMDIVFLHQIVKAGTTWYKTCQNDHHLNNMKSELILIN
jgi:hypothetical protein